jgi:hypothetical protein
VTHETFTLAAALVTVAACTARDAGGAELLVPEQHPTIQAAIDAAAPGDTVVVAAGVYSGPGNRDLNFAGKAITVRSADGPESTIILVGATPQRPARGVVFNSGESALSVLEGFTITGGATAPGAIADEFNGGAILCNNLSSPTIRDCVISGNSCGCWGAGICCTNASPTIIGCRITGNFAADQGGGVFAWQESAPTIISSLIAGNASPVTGAGVAMFGGAAGSIVNSTIAGNLEGGGVLMWGGTIANSIVWGNQGMSLWLGGGATVTHSNVQGGAAGPGNTNVDPMFVDPAAGDFHLASTSPLIGAGSAALLPAGAGFDFEGDLRVVGPQVDMGADERRSPGDLDSNGWVDAADLAALVLAWGACPAVATCVADLDQDGAVGVADLVALVLDWSLQG